jgi:hypothetical protein
VWQRNKKWNDYLRRNATPVEDGELTRTTGMELVTYQNLDAPEQTHVRRIATHLGIPETVLTSDNFRILRGPTTSAGFQVTLVDLTNSLNPKQQATFGGSNKLPKVQVINAWDMTHRTKIWEDFTSYCETKQIELSESCKNNLRRNLNATSHGKSDKGWFTEIAANHREDYSYFHPDFLKFAWWAANETPLPAAYAWYANSGVAPETLTKAGELDPMLADALNVLADPDRMQQAWETHVEIAHVDPATGLLPTGERPKLHIPGDVYGLLPDGTALPVRRGGGAIPNSIERLRALRTYREFLDVQLNIESDYSLQHNYILRGINPHGGYGATVFEDKQNIPQTHLD